MTKYHFTRDNAFKFEHSDKLTGYDYGVNSETINAGLSYVSCDGGDHKLTTCHTSDLYYYIIEGQGEFSIAGNLFQVKATDVVVVPKNTAFGYAGQLKFVEMMNPAYTDGCTTTDNKSIYD